MGPRLRLQKAVPADPDQVRAPYNEVGAWLHNIKGVTDQWDRQIPDDEVHRMIATYGLYLVWRGRQLVGAVRSSFGGSPLWAERRGDAVSVHELAVRAPSWDRALAAPSRSVPSDRQSNRGHAT